MIFLATDYDIPKRGLLIPIGVPAAGKTTLRKEFMAKAISQHMDLCIISPDEIRFKLLDFEHTGKSFDEKIEPDVWQTAMYQLGKCVQKGDPIFVDATSVSKADRKKLIDKVKDEGYRVEAHFLQIHPEYASWRDAKRLTESTGIEKRSVKPSVIYQKYWAIQPPEKAEGIHEIFVYDQHPTKAECGQMHGTWEQKKGICSLKLEL